MKKLSLLLGMLLVACGSSPTPPPRDPPPPAEVALQVPHELPSAPDPGPVSVTSEDPQWGDPLAPVTLVVFTDFQCPHCSKVGPKIAELKAEYGPSKLRVVVKHLPLEFHEEAPQAARIAAGVHKRAGNDAFWAFYHAMALEPGGAPFSEVIAGALVRASEVSGQSPDELLRESAHTGEKVAQDLALAAELGIRSTPTILVNGATIRGNLPLDAFREVIDLRLTSAALSLERGIPRERIYAHETATALREEQEAAAARARAEVKAEERIADKAETVPVGTSPQKGPADALVTIVMFGDYQCPFCVRGAATMRTLEQKYGKEVRFVAKHSPLPSHEDAPRAARLAEIVRAQKGDVAFFKAHDDLYALGAQFTDADLETIAQRAGLDGKQAMKALDQGAEEERLLLDGELAAALSVRATPAYFVNGRRALGALAVEEFSRVIDEEVAKAKQLVASGVARTDVYAELQKSATPQAALEKRAPGAPPAQSPALGPKNAPVVVQVFTDFQCPFCARHALTLKALQEQFPNEVRLVVRNLPLPFHKDARSAANLALFARSAKGDKGYFDMHDRLFAAQRSLDRESLLVLAKDAGLDAAKAEKAISESKFENHIASDEKRAKELDVKGTPGTFFNDYFVSGAQSEAALRRALRQALADKGKKLPAPARRKPAKQTVAAPAPTPPTPPPTRTSPRREAPTGVNAR